MDNTFRKKLSKHFKLTKEFKRLLIQSTLTGGDRRKLIELEAEYQERRKSLGRKRGSSAEE